MPALPHSVFAASLSAKKMILCPYFFRAVSQCSADKKERPKADWLRTPPNKEKLIKLSLNATCL